MTRDLGKDLIRELTGFVHRRVTPPEDADDLVQEILLKVLDSSGPNSSEKFPQWFFTVAKNKIIDHYRKQANRFKTVDVETQTLAQEDATENETSAFHIAIKSLMSGLSERDQQALRAVDLKGLSQKAFAERENLSYPTAKSRVQRARKRLKDALEDCCRIELDRRGNPIGMTSKKNPACC